MESTSFIFNNPETNLKMTAKQFTISGGLDGLTLLFAHAIGSHKEQWEPFLDDLLKQLHLHGHDGLIREVWTFDFQSHGEAGMLNGSLLKQRSCLTPQDWAEDLFHFLRSDHIRGHRAVAIGHSAGSTAWTLATTGFTKNIPLSAIVHMEPAMCTRYVYINICRKRPEMIHQLPQITLKRRERWSSRTEARSWLGCRLPWKNWDSRVLDIYVKDGLYETASETNPAGIHVRLKCDKHQEAAAYADKDHMAGADQLSVLCPRIPGHIIFGTQGDVMPKYTQDALHDGQEGRVMASITHIPHVGHMMVQEHPTVAAKALFTVLENIHADLRKAKL